MVNGCSTDRLPTVRSEAKLALRGKPGGRVSVQLPPSEGPAEGLPNCPRRATTAAGLRRFCRVRPSCGRRLRLLTTRHCWSSWRRSDWRTPCSTRRIPSSNSVSASWRPGSGRTRPTPRVPLHQIRPRHQRARRRRPLDGSALANPDIAGRTERCCRWSRWTRSWRSSPRSAGIVVCRYPSPRRVAGPGFGAIRWWSCCRWRCGSRNTR